ncbi:VanZ family protein [Streptomyces sp. NPDC127197]|uniref:VanZ family protein n=1 Tax=Streptomyces sp. NPDC127197 TaxID=3345388 RepID=UPI0036265167
MEKLNFRIESWEVLGPLLLAFGVLLAVRVKRKASGWYGIPALTRVLAVLYAAGFLHFTFFPIIVDPSQNLTPWYTKTQVVPFLGVLGMDPSFVLNIVLFVPLGMLFLLTAKRELSLRRVALRSLAASATIEITQLVMYMLFSNGRSGDVDDLIANTLGGMLGFLTLRRAARSAALSGVVRHFALPGTTLAGAGVRTVASVPR